MADFNEEYMNPFHFISKEETNSLCNLITKKELTPQESEYRADILQIGQDTHKTIFQDIFVDKTKSMMDAIKKLRKIQIKASFFDKCTTTIIT